jgi:hypothetical protein
MINVRRDVEDVESCVVEEIWRFHVDNDEICDDWIGVEIEEDVVIIKMFEQVAEGDDHQFLVYWKC